MSSKVDLNRKFSKRTFSVNSCNIQGNTQAFRLPGCYNDKNWLDFSKIFFKICRSCSSSLLSLLVFIPQEAIFVSSLTVAWLCWLLVFSFIWTFARSRICLFCYVLVRNPANLLFSYSFSQLLLTMVSVSYIYCWQIARLHCVRPSHMECLIWVKFVKITNQKFES